MRIRKHVRNLAPPLPPSPTVPNSPDTHVCELNRSPWDVLASTRKFEYQAKIQDDYTCNFVGRESIYGSDMSSEEDEDCGLMEKSYVSHCVKKKGKTEIWGKNDYDYIRCGKIDGKGWHCKNEAKQGELLCEHHLLQKCKRNHRSVASKNKTVMAVNKKRNRKRVTSAPPDDFYFYCGFGPLWNKRRVQGGEAMEEMNTENIANLSSVEQVSNDLNHESVDGVFDDLIYEDDDEGENGGKMRIRKPIKARSLKSLF